MTVSIVGTVVTSGTGLGTTATSHTFSRPTNTLQVGDYVWAVFSQRGSTSAPGTPPSGWTSTGFVSISTSPGGGSGLWYKRFTSQAEIDADTGSYSASFSARALLVSCGIIRGADNVSSPSNASSTDLIDTLTYSSIAATRPNLCLAWLARNGAGAPGFEFLQPSGFTELVDFTATTQDVSHGVASQNFSSNSGSVSYSYSTTTTRLNGGMTLFFVDIPVALSTRAKNTISQTTINPTTVQNQITQRPLVLQSAQNPTQLIQNARLTSRHQNQLLNPATLLQQLRTKPQINLTFNTLQDPVLISFRTNLKPQIKQSLIAQKTLTHQINVQNTITQFAQNSTRIQHSAQINQNVLVNVQNQTRLIQTTRNKLLSRQTVQNSSTLQSTVNLIPLVDTRINVANTEIILSFRTLAIAQIRQKIESPQPLYISTHINHHASIICQGTLRRPKFSLGLSKEFFLTRPTAKFTKV